MPRRIVGLGLVMACVTITAGCSTSVKFAPQAPPQESALVYIHRCNGGLYFAGPKTKIKFNGQQVARLDRHQYMTVLAPPGDYTLTADNPGDRDDEVTLSVGAAQRVWVQLDDNMVSISTTASQAEWVLLEESQAIADMQEQMDDKDCDFTKNVDLAALGTTGAGATATGETL